YPTARKNDAELIAEANANGATAAVAIDSPEHLDVLEMAGRARGTRVPIVVDVDVGWEPLGGMVHVGVRRSPIRLPSEVVALARRAADSDGLRFAGVMAYEAQIAGVPDAGAAIRFMKAASSSDVAKTRARIAAALVDVGLAATVFNGGGTGSVAACARESALTEV